VDLSCGGTSLVTLDIARTFGLVVLSLSDFLLLPEIEEELDDPTSSAADGRAMGMLVVLVSTTPVEVSSSESDA
jgi:hypothetical protein